MSIQDERQYQVIRAVVEKCRALLAARAAAPAPESVDSQLHQAGLDAVRAQLDELERDLREYEKRSSGAGTEPEA